jgi:hypothetical protein
MQAGLVPVCIPLFEGCLSISAACRSEPVIYLFRSIMLPMSVLLVGFWWLNYRYLTQILPDRRLYRTVVLTLSVTGSVFLILYVIFLGTDGKVYEFLRRLGIYVFFGGTGVAQLLTTIVVRQQFPLKSAESRIDYRRLYALRIQTLIVLAMLIVGPVNLIFKQYVDNPRQFENIIEWNFGLIMFCWYGLQSIVCLPRGVNQSQLKLR